MGKIQNGDVVSAQLYGGVGLRPPHYPHILEHGTREVQWFEAISENYMDTHGRPRHILRQIRKDYPVALHGVSMSLGSPDGLNLDYLQKLKSLVEEINPFIVSDHLCWTRFGGHYTHDLLPLTYNDTTLCLLTENIQKAQDILKQTILIENISAYIQPQNGTMNEWDFLRELTKKSGCKLLLDINNVYVNAVNFNFDPTHYLDAIPVDAVGQIHLSGFTDTGEFLFDTHAQPVHEKVWDLFRRQAKDLNATPVLIEWDDDIPSFPELENELRRAKQIWQESHTEKHHDEVVL